ncbi:DUF3592 domain-containing protein [Deinococcus sp. Marseille-Q6407]|uniref:DUF3592 domain-containing protein n=1 Tax=Deinococcus sp. Marseille-Q6407 TaxID=2969223 RepID=UPI0021C04DDB|nr:DUF3592 domain-containing protein [Deinococcus sp. Marseille-Q6407]
MNWLVLLFTLPLLALGLFLLWLGGLSLWTTLLGGTGRDTYRWPEVPATVLSHQVEHEHRGNQIALSRGAQTETVRAAVTVQLEDGTLAEVWPPELARMTLTQPPGLSFQEFMAAADGLALAEAQKRLPAGQTILVLAAPAAHRVIRASPDGQPWTAAYPRGTLASKPLSLLASLFMLGFGLLLVLWAALMLLPSTAPGTS